MKLDFETYEEGFGGELRCPSCGFHYLHHDKVEVFERGEDAENGLHVVVESGTVRTDTNLQRNPSSRRHGLSVHFWCEGCDAKPVMTLIQHKGNTFVDIN